MGRHKKCKINQSAVLVNKKGEVLILHGKTGWQLPGGRLEEGESVEKGLLREIREETGIKRVKIKKLIDARLSYSGKTYLVTFLCTTPTTKVKLSDEHKEFAWIKRSEVCKYRFWFKGTKKIIKQYI